MWTLLVHAKTVARIVPAFTPFANEISPIILDDEGDLKHPWGKSEADAAIAYGTQDAYFSPSVMVFFQTLLGFEQLDWFQSSAAGTEHPMLQAVGKKAELYSASHEQSEAIAEWVLWAGFDFFQRGQERRAAQAARNWTRLPFREISDTHWLVVGFGAIGQAVGRRLKTLGAEVTGVRRSGGGDPAADRIIPPGEVSNVLRTVDAVLLCLPHTPETEDFADAAFFEAMKPGSLFLNVGRGASVNEAALLEALDKGRVAQACLDVVREEPLPKDNALWVHPRVVLTPHLSAQTEQAQIRTDAVIIENLRRFLDRDPLRNHVQKSVFS